MQLDGSRILLRDFRRDDISAYQGYHADKRYLEFYGPEVSDPMHAQQLVEVFVRTAHEEPRSDYTMAIIDRDTLGLIGCCSLRTARQPAGQAEFGLELSPDWWGRGLAVEAARTLLEFGFTALALSQVRGESVTENRRVNRLVRNLGFERIAIRPGTAWMNKRGWTYSNWLLTKSAWAVAANKRLERAREG